MQTKPEIHPPNFSLQRKIGAPVKQMPQSLLMAADKALEKLADKFDAFSRDVMTRWKSNAASTDQIYHDAHEYRGLAGTFRRKSQGKIADALCKYIDAAKDAGVEPDPETVKTIKDALLAAAQLEASDPHASAKISEYACEAAVKRIADLKKN